MLVSRGRDGVQMLKDAAIGPSWLEEAFTSGRLTFA